MDHDSEALSVSRRKMFREIGLIVAWSRPDVPISGVFGANSFKAQGAAASRFPAVAAMESHRPCEQVSRQKCVLAANAGDLFFEY